MGYTEYTLLSKVFNDELAFGFRLGVAGKTWIRYGVYYKYSFSYKSLIGVAQFALLFPKSEMSGWLIRDVLILPYWQMHMNLYQDKVLQVHQIGYTYIIRVHCICKILYLTALACLFMMI